MDNNEIRRKILKSLYEVESDTPGMDLYSPELKQKLGSIEEKELNFNINYLKNEGFIDVREVVGGEFEAEITSKGINLVEDNSRFDNLFQSNKIQTSLQPLKAFICYSNIERDSAATVKNILDDFNINCFMASEDTDASEEWMEKIFDEITNSEIFIPLLSLNFKKSKWCPQELGIACYVKYYLGKQIQIVPLGLYEDEHSKPFGFLGIRIQGKGYNELNLVNPIFKEHQEYMIPKSIDVLSKTYGFRKAEFIMGLLEPYFGDLSEEDVNKVVLVAINNDQVNDADLCKNRYLPQLITINSGKIDPEHLEKLQEILRRNRG